MRPATPEEVAGWDALVVANPDGGNVLQSKAFGQTKGRHGWTERYFMFGGAAVLVLERTLPQLGKLWYVPKGPGVTEKLGLKAFADEARKLDSPPFLIKIDPEIQSSVLHPKDLKRAGYVLAPRDLQYNTNTVIIDLTPTEDEILASFKQKIRYNIRLAAKKGVVAKPVPTSADTIASMYHLYSTTTKRAGVYLRSKRYFADFWGLHAEQGSGQMFIAEYEGQPLAGAFITHLGRKALYKDGGSVREHTDVQAPYALQWEIMRWLKSHGVTEYDMHGTPPADQLEGNHHMVGPAKFKLGFYSEITQFIGTYDLVLDEKKYKMWIRFGERLAVAYEYRVKKQLFY